MMAPHPEHFGSVGSAVAKKGHGRASESCWIDGAVDACIQSQPQALFSADLDAAEGPELREDCECARALESAQIFSPPSNLGLTGGAMSARTGGTQVTGDLNGLQPGVVDDDRNSAGGGEAVVLVGHDKGSDSARGPAGSTVGLLAGGTELFKQSGGPPGARAEGEKRTILRLGKELFKLVKTRAAGSKAAVPLPANGGGTVTVTSASSSSSSGSRNSNSRHPAHSGVHSGESRRHYVIGQEKGNSWAWMHGVSRSRSMEAIPDVDPEVAPAGSKEQLGRFQALHRAKSVDAPTRATAARPRAEVRPDSILTGTKATRTEAPDSSDQPESSGQPAINLPPAGATDVISRPVQVKMVGSGPGRVDSVKNSPAGLPPGERQREHPQALEKVGLLVRLDAEPGCFMVTSPNSDTAGLSRLWGSPGAAGRELRQKGRPLELLLDPPRSPMSSSYEEAADEADAWADLNDAPDAGGAKGAAAAAAAAASVSALDRLDGPPQVDSRVSPTSNLFSAKSPRRFQGLQLSIPNDKPPRIYTRLTVGELAGESASAPPPPAFELPPGSDSNLEAASSVAAEDCAALESATLTSSPSSGPTEASVSPTPRELAEHDAFGDSLPVAMPLSQPPGSSGSKRVGRRWGSQSGAAVAPSPALAISSSSSSSSRPVLPQELPPTTSLGGGAGGGLSSPYLTKPGGWLEAETLLSSSQMAVDLAEGAAVMGGTARKPQAPPRPREIDTAQLAVLQPGGLEHLGGIPVAKLVHARAPPREQQHPTEVAPAALWTAHPRADSRTRRSPLSEGDSDSLSDPVTHRGKRPAEKGASGAALPDGKTLTPSLTQHLDVASPGGSQSSPEGGEGEQLLSARRRMRRVSFSNIIEVFVFSSEELDVPPRRLMPSLSDTAEQAARKALMF